MKQNTILKTIKKNQEITVIVGIITVGLLFVYFMNTDDEKESTSSLDDLQQFAKDNGFVCDIDTESSGGEPVTVLQCISGGSSSTNALSFFAVTSTQTNSDGSVFLVIEKTRGVTSRLNAEIFSKGFETEIYKGTEIRTVTDNNIETSIITTDKYIIASASRSNSKHVIKELLSR